MPTKLTSAARRLFAEIGAIGGKIGGKATGEKKRRSDAHYKRMARLSALARKRKMEAKLKYG